MGKGNGHQGDYHLIHRGDACKRLGGDPTHPPPPRMLADGPAPAYAVIHTSHHIPKHTPMSFQIPTPRGYIYFSECSCERSFLRLNSHHDTELVR